MKLQPYINFNGNAVDAIAFYEKAIGLKADACTWGDITKFDPNAEVPKGKEKWIMHACMDAADGTKFQLADCDEGAKNPGTNICLQLTYKTAGEVTAVYNALKDGGTILCELAPAFYAPLYSELIDKFGIRWSVMQDNPAQ